MALICAICGLFTPKVEVSGKEGKIPRSSSELFFDNFVKTVGDYYLTGVRVYSCLNYVYVLIPVIKSTCLAAAAANTESNPSTYTQRPTNLHPIDFSFTQESRHDGSHKLGYDICNWDGLLNFVSQERAVENELRVTEVSSEGG